MGKKHEKWAPLLVWAEDPVVGNVGDQEQAMGLGNSSQDTVVRSSQWLGLPQLAASLLTTTSCTMS